MFFYGPAKFNAKNATMADFAGFPAERRPRSAGTGSDGTHRAIRLRAVMEA